MNEVQKEKLFGEIALDMGLLTKEEVEKALAKQQEELAKGQKKFLGTILLEDNKLTNEQIDEILQIQLKTVRSTPQVHEIA